MEPLGRFYTADAISLLLVSRFNQETPRHILDIGAGDGALLHAAYNRWQHASFHAADIDPSSITKISRQLPFVHLQHIDGLFSGLNQKMNLKIGSVDIAICNPPYLPVRKTLQTTGLLQDSGLMKSLHLKRLTADIVFLAQNLVMLKTGGELGIILPDSIFSGHEFFLLREDLLTHHKINGIIQLPDKIFAKTEARTHILLLEKGIQTNRSIPLYQANNLGELTLPIYISQTEASLRLDYSYYLWRNQQKETGYSVTLADLGVEIKRGRSSRKILQAAGIQYFHTSSFHPTTPILKLTGLPIPGQFMAEPGDILISRVGKRCIGRVAVVESGTQVFTDCIYRLRTPEQYRTLIWQTLLSPSGQQWLNAHAHGVCARCLSKENLLTFPIPAKL